MYRERERERDIHKQPGLQAPRPVPAVAAVRRAQAAGACISVL